MPVKGDYKPIVHGTHRGYNAHKRRERSTGVSDHCEPCLKAHNLHHLNRRRAEKGLEPLTNDISTKSPLPGRRRVTRAPADKLAESAFDPRIVPFDALIVGDVIDVQVKPGALVARARIDNYRENQDGSVGMILSLHNNKNKKARAVFPKRRVDQGFLFVPTYER
nr:hypothetical protein [Rhodococcus sp. (in: high G+C Gram-positive bacteria)]